MNWTGIVVALLMTLAQAYAFADANLATNASQMQLKGIHYNFDVNSVSKTADGGDDFPFAHSCSCHLTDSCSISCASNQEADCNPINENGALYCSCYCE